MNEKSSGAELTEEILTRHEEIFPGVFVIGYRRVHDFKPGQTIKLGRISSRWISDIIFAGRPRYP